MSVDLSTTYLGLKLRNPLVVSACPLSMEPHLARRLIAAGANGLVLFNRFLQPDIDLETLEVAPNLTLSGPDDLRLPLRWIAILRGQTEASLAATSGIHSAEDVIKLLLVGADVGMTASALIRGGPDRLAEIISGMRDWLARKQLSSIEEIKGLLSQARAPDGSAFERVSYLRTLMSLNAR